MEEEREQNIVKTDVKMRGRERGAIVGCQRTHSAFTQLVSITWN